MKDNHNRKVFICLDKGFTRKNASANYVEYLAKALQSENMSVSIISISDKKDECNRWMQYQKMKYCNVYYDVSTPLRTIGARINLGFDMWNCILSCQIGEDDIIICYSDNYFMLKILQKESVLRKIKIINCVTEWHVAAQFKYGYFDMFNYWFYCLGFYKGIGCSKNVIAVSRKIEEYFYNKGCRTFILPPLIDSFEFPYQKKKNDDKIRFIYSGSFKNKDSMKDMLLGIAGLEKEKRQQIEFHITGRNSEKLKQIMIEMGDKWYKIADCVISHEWLSYEELVKLYQKIHFLFLARLDNRVTQSNFPSKIPEMMSYGIIPIMNKVGDCPEYYLEDGRDSILFDVCDTEACSKVVLRAVDLLPEQRRLMQCCAREKAEQIFHYKVWSKKIKGFLDE